MNDSSYEHIRNMVMMWYQNALPNLLSEFDYVEVSKDEKDVVIIDMTFENCLAQISIANPAFAPYRYIFFEAMTLDSKKAIEKGQAELVYFFYDSSEMSEDDIIYELNFGVKYCSTYIPDKLGEIYINKRGRIIIDNEKVDYKIHPDDLKKIGEISFNDEFICTDTQFQYLVVENNKSSLRILPSIFSEVQ